MNQFELTKTIMQNLKDLDLKPSEQLVLLHIAQFDFVKQKTIIEKSGLAKSTVIEAYKVLKEKGILNKKSEIQTLRFKIQTFKSPNSRPPCHDKNTNKNQNKVISFQKETNYINPETTRKLVNESFNVNNLSPYNDKETAIKWLSELSNNELKHHFIRDRVLKIKEKWNL